MYLKNEHKMWIAGDHIYLEPRMANRHGLITGATGTGKTVTLKVLAEGFSDMGVPVFLSDIKGDLSGFLKPVEMNDNVNNRVSTLGLDGFEPTTYPVTFFDVFKKRGIPLRATVSDVGPQLLSRLMDLNDTQTGIMNLTFKIADDLGWLLIDLKDLRAMLQYVSENREKYSGDYGNIAPQSVGAILRQLLVLEEEGADEFFGEPAMDINDWFKQDGNGKGMINVLSSTELFNKPLLYATVMLWLMTELYENLDEQGDSDKPRIVFFFDEAHVLFDGAPKALVSKVEQVIKLIRSKGVGIYFITQNPADIPDDVLSQLGNRIQHALRAYTPKEQKAMKAAAASFRENPEFDTLEVLGQLGTGEALVSCLDPKGVPQIVQRAIIVPPQSYMGKSEDHLVNATISNCALASKYQEDVDRVSAYETIKKQNQIDEQNEAQAKQQAEYEKKIAQQQKEIERLEKKAYNQKTTRRTTSSRRRTTNPLEKTVNSALNTIGRELGKNIVRSIFGTRKR